MLGVVVDDGEGNRRPGKSRNATQAAGSSKVFVRKTQKEVSRRSQSRKRIE